MTTETAHACARLWPAMRACLVYDCLYPFTIGGAERWYRNLAERLSRKATRSPILTRRQWGEEQSRCSGRTGGRGWRRMELYAAGTAPLPPIGSARRAPAPLRHGRYDVVHSASFPYFSLLAAAVARRRGGYRIVVDWHEVWTRATGARYLGRVAANRLARPARVPARAAARICFSRLHEQRLREVYGAADARGPVRAAGSAGAAPPPPPRRRLRRAPTARKARARARDGARAQLPDAAGGTIRRRP